MILTLQSPPSLHNRALREAFHDQCQAQVGPLTKKLYRVRFDFYGDYFKDNGEPRRRDVDNQIKVILDEVAKAGGIDDCWLQRHWDRMEVHQAQNEYVVVELW